MVTTKARKKRGTSNIVPFLFVKMWGLNERRQEMNVFNDIARCLTSGQARVVIKDIIYDQLLTNIENGYVTSASKEYTRYRTRCKEVRKETRN